MSRSPSTSIATISPSESGSRMVDLSRGWRSRFDRVGPDKSVLGLTASDRRAMELEEFDRVAGPDLAFIRLGDVGVDLIDHRARIGPLVFDVRKVGGEHDVVDADIVALLDRDPLVLNAEIDVIANV